MTTFTCSFLILLCILIVCVIYYILIHPKIFTPMDIYRRLIQNYPDFIIAFTYKKINNNKYLNYYLNDSLVLEPREEDHPVTFDGLPYQNNKSHGNITESNDGFSISGIDFPFRCPLGWDYIGNGKCTVKPICNDNDINVYRGINQYQFNELRRSNTNFAFHSRLYVDCDTNTELACQPNELYIGGNKISKDLNPCEPYDLCIDRIQNYTHRFPIKIDDVIPDNAFYRCINGKSVLQTCANNTIFSEIQQNCVPISQCAREIDNTTFPNTDTSFILCRNGNEFEINCPSGVFIDENGRHECTNINCGLQIQYQQFLNFIRIPISWSQCPENSNTPLETSCVVMPDIVFDTPPDNTNYRFSLLCPRFGPYPIPKKYLDTTTFTCEDFSLDLEQFILTSTTQGTHSPSLPLVNINVFTKNIQYNNPTETPLYYKSYLNIVSVINNEHTIIAESNLYANFTSSFDITSILYLQNLALVYGDVDGVIFLTCPSLNKIHNRSIVSLKHGYYNDYLVESTKYFNAYVQDFTTIEEAHSVEALDLLKPFTQSTIFEYYAYLGEDNDVYIATWSTYGAVLIKATLKSNILLINNKLSDPHNVDMEQCMNDIGHISPLNAYVSNIVNQTYTYIHEPFWLSYIENINLISPNQNIEINKLFYVDPKYIYQNPSYIPEPTSFVPRHISKPLGS